MPVVAAVTLGNHHLVLQMVAGSTRWVHRAAIANHSLYLRGLCYICYGSALERTSESCGLVWDRIAHPTPFESVSSWGAISCLCMASLLAAHARDCCPTRIKPLWSHTQHGRSDKDCDRTTRVPYRCDACVGPARPARACGCTHDAPHRSQAETPPDSTQVLMVATRSLYMHLF